MTTTTTQQRPDIVIPVLPFSFTKRLVQSPVKPGVFPELLLIASHPTDHDLEAKAFGEKGFNAAEIKRACEDAGIAWERVHITAMCKHGLTSKSKPSTEDLAEYTEILDAEIAAIQPKLIMSLGAEPFKRMMKANTTMGGYVGEIIDCPYGKLLANYAPGMVMADPTKRPEFKEHFALAKKFLDDTLEYTPFNYRIVTDPAENLAILNHYIQNGMFEIGYDAEWFGTKWSDDEVMFDFQYSLEPDMAIVLDISPDGITENLELLNTMKAILEHPNVRRMGWNIRADDLRLRKRGFNLADETLAFDGMKAVAFFDSRLSKGLETGIKNFTNYDPYYVPLHRAMKQHKVHGHEMAKMKFLERDLYYRYCGGDAVSHREACLRMAAAFPEHLKPLYYNVYLPLTHYMTDMEFTGIPINKEILQDITDKYSSKYEELKAQLLAYLKERFEIEDFNPNSAIQKKKLLFETLQLDPAYYTKSGKSPKSAAWYNRQKEETQALYAPSTNAKSLSTMRFELETRLKEETDETLLEPMQAALNVISLLLNTSRVGVFATKFLSTRGIQMDDEAEEDDEDEPLKQSYWAATCKDDKIHASFFECLKNFRASSSPNVQNPASKVLAYIPDIFVPGYSKLPKDEQKQYAHLIPKNIRNIFTAGHPDYCFIETDISGADLAIMAFLSQDADFIHDIRAGSFHQTKMREYFNDPTLTKKDASKYVISKSITFRVSYTSGLVSAAMPIQADIYAENGLLVDLETITYALQTWKRYTRYMAYRDQCNAEVEEKQQISNARGLVLKYEQTDSFGVKSGWLNESLAFPVASELAWFMWECSVNLKNILKSEGLWMKYIFPTNTVHDAGYWLAHKDLLKDNYIQEVIKHVFCHQTKLVTGHNVGCEMVVADCWKGKNVLFEKETKWDFENNIWRWKE